MNKKQLKELVSTTVDYSLAIERLFMILAIIFFVLGIVFKTSLIFCSIIILICSVLYGYLSFCLNEYATAKKMYGTIAVTVCFAVCEIFNGVLFKSPFPTPIAVFLIAFIDLAIMLTTWWFLHPDEETRSEQIEKTEKLLKENIYLTDNGFEFGDTFLGYNIETGKPNIIPYKDRFLHFLVLGVTGCGKTSQSLIPMVERDMEYSKDEDGHKGLSIVCLDPKGDFAEMVCALAVMKGRKEEEITYFNPVLVDCPYFNPMVGDIDPVSECLVTTFKNLENEQQKFFANMNEMLLRKCIKVAKWRYGDDANLSDVNILMTNPNKMGEKMLQEVNEMMGNFDKTVESEFLEIQSWFMKDYYTGLSGQYSSTKTYEQCSGVRNQVAKLLTNSLVKRILCPTDEYGNKISIKDMEPGTFIDFEGVLNNGGVLAMSSAQGELRELGTFIGYFLILSFESAVFRRSGSEDDRRGCIFYVDEFQKYANEGYNDLLTQGRSYRVSSVLATQTRAGIAANSPGQEGKNLIETVSSNCRNKIIYPGSSFEDASYYSKEFGEKKEKKQRISHSHNRSLAGKLSPANQNENISTEEKLVPKFTPTEIMKRPFGEAITYTVKYNSVQEPQVVKLRFINSKLKKKCDKYIKERIRPRQVNHIDDEYLPEDGSNHTPLYTTGNMNLQARGGIDNDFLNNEGDHSSEFENLEDL